MHRRTKDVRKSEPGNKQNFIPEVFPFALVLDPSTRAAQGQMKTISSMAVSENAVIQRCYTYW
eukprot:32232-Amphidinium_carterae.1